MMATEWKTGDKIRDIYEIRMIKSGGMGIVYLCYDHENNRPIAAKTLHDQFLSNKDMVNRFIDEANIWVDLGTHKNIVRADFVDYIEHRPFIFLEYIRGHDEYGADLKSWIELGALNEDLDTIMDFALQICDGMIYAEQAFQIKRRGERFVHRDIKPANIMVTRDNVIKVTDFGLARSVFHVTGDINADETSDNPSLTKRGTPPYTPPEQWDGRPTIDVRADIYAFGCVLYEMITSHHVFSSQTPREFHYHHFHTQPRSISSIPPELNGVILRCLEKRPEDRYTNFAELRDQLAIISRDYSAVDVIKVDKPQEPKKEEDEWKLLENAYSLDQLARGREHVGKHEEARELYEKALVFYERAQEINPRNPQTWLNKGFALDQLGRYQEALLCYDKSLEIVPIKQTLASKGETLRKLGEYQAAICCCDQALEMDSRYAVAWHNKATALRELGKYDEAISCYDGALRINPRIVETWINKGQILGDLGRYKEGIECYDKALEMHPSFPVVAMTLSEKGYALGMLGEYEKEIECDNKALEIDSTDVTTWYNKGFALGKLGRRREEITCYDKALDIDNRYTSAWNNKGFALAQLGRYQEAIDCYNEALAIDHGYEAAQINKKEALHRLGRFR